MVFYNLYPCVFIRGAFYCFFFKCLARFYHVLLVSSPTSVILYPQYKYIHIYLYHVVSNSLVNKRKICYERSYVTQPWFPKQYAKSHLLSLYVGPTCPVVDVISSNHTYKGQKKQRFAICYISRLKSITIVLIRILMRTFCKTLYSIIRLRRIYFVLRSIKQCIVVDHEILPT